MADRLIQILTFVDVPGGGGAVPLPHQININGIPQVPDFVALDVGGFAIAVTTTTCTVTNNNVDPVTVNVWLELKHSIPRVLGAVQTTELTPRPFVAAAGGGGGGTSPWERDAGPTPGITSLVNPTDAVVIGVPGFGNAQALHVIKDTQGGNGTEIVEVRGLAVPGSFNVLELADVIMAFASYFKAARSTTSRSTGASTVFNHPVAVRQSMALNRPTYS